MSCIVADVVVEDSPTVYAANAATVIYVAANILSGSSLAAKPQKLTAYLADRDAKVQATFLLHRILPKSY